MRGRVIAHGRLANVAVDDGIDLVAHTEGFLGHNLMGAHTLNRRVATSDVGDDGIVIVRVKPSAVANLPAGFGIERRVIENDFALLARLEFLHALTVLDDGENLAAIGASLTVAFEIGFRQFLINGIGSLLGRAFPGSASALALLLHRVVETSLVEGNSL